MIGIYFDKLLYSPFDFPSFRKKAEKDYRVVVLKHHVRANIIISSYLNVLERYITKYGKSKKYLLWTHEPYHNFTLNKIKKFKETPIHIMNVYTGDVFVHNFRYFYFRTPLKKLEISKGDSIRSAIVEDQKPIVALSTFYTKNYYENNPLTLLPVRYNLIETGFKKGLVDVHGKGWEKHKYVSALGNSRNQGDRRDSKQKILESYKFNLCVENTCVPYYVTEKIWEPIKYGCLPIYYSNDTIYEVFPKNSFIDAKEFKNADELYEYIEKMTEKEYKERYNLCVDAFNKVIEEGKNTTWRGKSENMNINYLEYKTCYDKLMKKIEKII